MVDNALSLECVLVDRLISYINGMPFRTFKGSLEQDGSTIDFSIDNVMLTFMLGECSTIGLIAITRMDGGVKQSEEYRRKLGVKFVELLQNRYVIALESAFAERYFTMGEQELEAFKNGYANNLLSLIK